VERLQSAYRERRETISAAAAALTDAMREDVAAELALLEPGQELEEQRGQHPELEEQLGQHPDQAKDP
jgi:hypothetical protein